jgi:hypothetical protein
MGEKRSNFVEKKSNFKLDFPKRDLFRFIFLACCIMIGYSCF